MALEGHEIPIHKSLIDQILIGGVPRTIALVNGTLVAALGLGLHSFLALPVGILVHLLALAATKADPDFFSCFRRHIRQKNIYTV
ncbi:VirB3 family type IV secretion system protein [Geomonas anaerohicana]|uniref:VirB3 family type IV secretion system protein n=1 Tax=Geomonas anaerohicana TaxID=2798583 RepID=A0ABS0YCP8_9BACT|nr:VirB3 family type IV secretion system protein [Geomonas anaerohicana]MBJ6749924.1 VirB3 family type IV secretion system protein [Geomonas anaerohicana]